MSGSTGLWRFAVCFVVVAAACGGSDQNLEAEDNPRGLPEAAEVQRPAAAEDTEDAASAVTGTDSAISDEVAHPDDSSPGASPAETVCDAGEVVLEQYVSDSDDGCRPAACELGRDYKGECLGEHVALIAGPTTTLAPQPAGEPCEQPAAGDALSFSSDSFDPDNRPLVHLERGTWRLDICVRHNDRATGRPERLTITLASPVVEGQTMSFHRPLDVISVANGAWSSDEFPISYPDPIPPLRLNVDTDGGGDWVVTFTQTAAEARTVTVHDPTVTGGAVAVTAEPTGGRYLTIDGTRVYVVFIGPHGDLTYGISWTAENAVSVALDTRRPGGDPSAGAPALQSGTWTLPTPTDPGALIHNVYAHGVEPIPVRAAVQVRFMYPAE